MIEQSVTNINIRNQKNMKRWGIVLMIPLIIAFIVTCCLGAKWKDSLRVNRVIVQGLHILSVQQIFSLANIQLKTPFDSIDIFRIHKRILQQPFVKSARVTRHYPDAIDIQIVERVPIASVNNGHLNYIDTEKIVLPYIESSSSLDLPIISGVDGIHQSKVGEKIENPELAIAINLLQIAISIDSSLYHFISEINLNDGKDIILYSSDVGVPILLGRDDIEKKLLTLQTFWNNYVKPPNAQSLQYVDLRFNDQVVVKWRTEESQTKESL